MAKDIKGDLVGAVVCFAAGAMVYYDLAKLENGSEASVEIWAPLARLYEKFGFSATVCALPCLGFLFLCLAIYKYFKSSSESATEVDE